MCVFLHHGDLMTITDSLSDIELIELEKARTLRMLADREVGIAYLKEQTLDLCSVGGQAIALCVGDLFRVSESCLAAHRNNEVIFFGREPETWAELPEHYISYRGKMCRPAASMKGYGRTAFQFVYAFTTPELIEPDLFKAISVQGTLQIGTDAPKSDFVIKSRTYIGEIDDQDHGRPLEGGCTIAVSCTSRQDPWDLTPIDKAMITVGSQVVNDMALVDLCGYVSLPIADTIPLSFQTKQRVILPEKPAVLLER